MNIEFLLLIIDYFRILKRRDILLDWLAPSVLAIGFFIFNSDNSKISGTVVLLANNSIGLLGILVGFSIAVITLLITANTKNIEDIKSLVVGWINQYKSVSLFDLMIITYTYSVIMEIFLIIFNLFLLSTGFIEGKYTFNANLIASIDILFILHMLFVTIRNVTNFYFVLIKK